MIAPKSSPARQPTTLTHTSAATSGQIFSPLGRSASSGGHCEPMTTGPNTTGSNMEGYR